MNDGNVGEKFILSNVFVNVGRRFNVYSSHLLIDPLPNITLFFLMEIFSVVSSRISPPMDPTIDGHSEILHHIVQYPFFRIESEIIFRRLFSCLFKSAMKLFQKRLIMLIHERFNSMNGMNPIGKSFFILIFL